MARGVVDVVARAAIPPPDNSLKWKDYVLIFSAGALVVFLAMWVLWRLWLPIRAIRREKRRLQAKFAPQDIDANAILRPETIHNQREDHIKLVWHVLRFHCWYCHLSSGWACRRLVWCVASLMSVTTVLCGSA